MKKLPALSRFVNKQRFVKTSGDRPKTNIDIKSRHNISVTIRSLPGKVWNIRLFNIYRIFICLIYSRGTFCRRRQKERCLESPSSFSLVSAFISVVLGRINNALSRVGTPATEWTKDYCFYGLQIIKTNCFISKFYLAIVVNVCFLIACTSTKVLTQMRAPSSFAYK